MTSSNTYGKFYLPREIRAKLALFQYQNDFGTSTVDSFKDLKEQILSGPVERRIMNSRRFKVEIPVKQFNEALCRRHYFGVRRIHRLCRSAERLANTKWATAWTLTTCYYAAFFAALELLHVTGTHVSYFSTEEIEELTTVALPSKDKLEAGTYLGVATFNATSGEIEITYAQSAQKPHDFTWHQLRQLIEQTEGGTEEASQHRRTILRLLGADHHGWARPNEIRNRWNYVDATLFSERGERLGAEMNDGIVQPRKTFRWGQDKHLHSSEENETVGIAYLRATLVEAVEHVAGAVLPQKLAAKLTN